MHRDVDGADHRFHLECFASTFCQIRQLVIIICNTESVPFQTGQHNQQRSYPLWTCTEIDESSSSSLDYSASASSYVSRSASAPRRTQPSLWPVGLHFPFPSLPQWSYLRLATAPILAGTILKYGSGSRDLGGDLWVTHTAYLA